LEDLCVDQRIIFKYLGEVGCKDVDWIRMDPDRNQWQILETSGSVNSQ
jgi:hypothetical protein